MFFLIYVFRFLIFDFWTFDFRLNKKSPANARLFLFVNPSLFS